MIDRSSETLDRLTAIATGAGTAALEYYEGKIEVEYKDDNSPLTLADRAAHAFIVEALRDWTPSVPVLSEESAAEDVAAHAEWTRLWIVDPLDGSKEFIKKSGQFTVNIALVEDGEPTLGIVHVPTSGVSYWGSKGEQSGSRASWVLRNGQPPQPIRVRRADLDRLTVVASRDHAGPRVTAFLESLPGAEATSLGSSLKFCLVAEGKADFYPRAAPTMEWDTAAAQCIVEAAGGHVTDFEGAPLRYNKRDLHNPHFICYGDASIDWVKLFRENAPEN